MNIINANYSKNWMKVKYKDLYVAYMKKADVKTADAYLAGAGREYQPYIKLAKRSKLTYTGILKDYSKTIKKKELCRLAVLWYQAMGNKLPKQKTTSPFKANNLISDSQVGYMIVPFDNQNVCLDVYEESRQEGGTIGLWNCTGNNNQRFFIDYDGGNYSLKNVNSLYTLSYSGNKVCQRLQGYKSQVITLEYNDDGSVCIRNGYGQYLDIKGGTAASGGTLTFKAKSGSSSQKFIFKF